MPINTRDLDELRKKSWSYRKTGGGSGEELVITDFSHFCVSGVRLDILDKIDTSKGTTFYRTFYSAKECETIPEIDTSSGTNFAEMFCGCSNMITIPELDTTNGTDFSSMFRSCTKLRTIQKIDVSNATTLYNMFNGCTALTQLRLYNIKLELSLGACTELDVDSIVHTIKELHKVSSSTRLTIGSDNFSKISNLRCRVLDDTTDKIEMELCDSTDEGAMALGVYARLKNWTIE